jgi:hypothetical protein
MATREGGMREYNRRAYNAAYYAANKEKMAAYRSAYYAANKEKMAAYRSAHYAANKEKMAAYARRWRAGKRGGPARISPWTPKRVSALIKLWATSLPASIIAKAIGGVTRNAVIGKAYRLKLRRAVFRP